MDYCYWISGIIDNVMDSKYIAFNISTPLIVEVEKHAEPLKFSLIGAYPNPFNPVTTIDYTLPMDMHMTLTIYNVSGQAVNVLKYGIQKAGKHSVSWNAVGMPSGIYFYSLKADGFTETKKLLLIK